MTNDIRRCTIPQCDRPLRCVGLCRSHYHRSQMGRALDSPIRPWSRRKTPCKTDNKVVSGSMVTGEIKNAHPESIGMSA
jgi:hypothetical protein